MDLILTSHTAELVFGRAAILVSLTYRYFGLVTTHGHLIRLVTW